MNTALTIGLDFAAPVPLHTDYSSGIFEGFEVDLMNMISVQLGLQLNYTVSLWKDILQQLEAGKIDIICSAVTVTPERKQRLDFTEPYLSFRLCAITHKEDKLNFIDEMRGKRIGVRKATEAEKFIRSYPAQNEIIYADTNDELYTLLSERNIHLVIDDSPIAGSFVRLHNNLHLSFFLPGTQADYAIAIRKGNVALQEQLNRALQQIKRDGNWQLIYDKWFKGMEL